MFYFTNIAMPVFYIKLGGGFSPSLVDAHSATLTPIVGNIQDIADGLWDYIYNNTECVDGEPDYISIASNLPIVEDLFSSNNNETDLYFYHPDHLGSSSFISDVNGDVNQHLQYLPFGESFIDQQTNHNIRFTFSAKEKDTETNYSYFWARYYNSDISVWLSVDPLASKYPSMSSFMYCAGNPVMLVDPDGRKIRPSSNYSNDLINSAIISIFKGKNISELFFTQNNNSESPNYGIISTASGFSNLNEKQFSRKLRRHGRKNNIKFSKEEIKDAFNVYKVIDHSAVFEIFATNNESNKDNSSFSDFMGNDNITNYKIHNKSLNEVAENLDLIEEGFSYCPDSENDKFYDVEKIKNSKSEYLDKLCGNDRFRKYGRRNFLINTTNQDFLESTSTVKKTLINFKADDIPW
ncbi:MAG: RHS repeat-associated core domain-containing protein [Saprospiraceae bacterium]|nr:RHS repeat-associated core domain-containing protein [Saprospiraceae bacterium]